MSKNDWVVREFDPLNPPPLTDEERAQLAALAVMPDEEIDTSDIPPLTEAFFARAVRNPFYSDQSRKLALTSLSFESEKNTMIDAAEIIVSEKHIDETKHILSAVVHSKKWRKAEKPSPYMAWEYLVPGSIVLLLLKPAWDEFAKKLGSAAGDLTVKKLTELFQYAREKINHRAYSRQDIDEILTKTKEADWPADKEIDFSKFNVGKKLSVLWIVTKYMVEDMHVNVRMIFDHDCSNEDFESALSELQRIEEFVREIIRFNTDRDRKLLEENQDISKNRMYYLNILLKGDGLGWRYVYDKDSVIFLKKQ